ncbi:MAG: putative peptidoglycan glycosyltransferase FtsW [Candidatus Falkowbacteria bacterium]|nr:putative peptidoglycan glycosyltransferase FtsW [Candidatus Falkowbacteria bacterium]
MIQKIKKWFAPLKGEHEPDKKLIVALAAILLFGLIMLSSASSVVSYLKNNNSYYYFNHQLIAIILGALACYLISRVDYHRWQKFALFFLFSSIGLLVLVFVPGLRSNYGTARSWINIFGQSIQPSELVKLAFLFYLSAWLEVKKNQLNDYSQGILPFIVILSLIGFLMYLQPDLGTLLILISTSIAVFFVGGGNFKHIMLVGLMGLAAIFLIYQVSSRPVENANGKTDYKASRFQCLKDPNNEKTKLDACYQINQSLIAVGSGGIFGRGLGQSRQKFNYLPEVYGDAIFPIISEEIGFICNIAFLFLFGFIFYRGYLISKKAPDGFGRNLAIGVVFWMIIQAFFNIGGMINIIPMTGVPLPFISYGGTAIISIMMAMGLLINISKQTKENLRVRNRQ